MKIVAKFLSVFTLLVLLVGSYILWATQLRVSSDGVKVESALDQAVAFEGIFQSANVGDDRLTVYQPIQDTPEQYVFVTYTLRARNWNLLPAEWVQLEITPEPGDVLLLNPNEEAVPGLEIMGIDVPALNEKVLNPVLLTSRSSTSHVRSGTLVYYIYGHEYSVPIQVGV